MRTFAALGMVAGLAACVPASVSRESEVEAAAQCKRDAPGQVRCLVEFFDAPSCTEAQALGTMHREKAAQATYQTITAYSASAQCRDELAERASALGFAQSGAPGQVSLEVSRNYRQVLTIGPEQLVEWERDKQ